MTAWMIVLGILAFLLLLLLVPVQVSLKFRQELCVRIRYAFVSFRLYPRPDKPKKEKPEKGKQKRKDKQEEGRLSQLEALLKEDGVSAVVEYLRSLAELAVDALRRVLRIVIVDRLQLRLTIVGEDAAQTAIRYGQVCGAVFSAQAVLETVMKVRRRDIRVEPGFLQEQGGTDIDLKVHVLPIRVVGAALGLLMRYLVNTVKQDSSKEPASKRSAG